MNHPGRPHLSWTKEKGRGRERERETLPSLPPNPSLSAVTD